MKPVRRVSIDLTNPIYDCVYAYAQATNPEGRIQDTLRELILVGAKGAQDAAIISARRRAYDEASRMVRYELGSKLREISARLLGEATSVESGSAGAPCNGLVKRRKSPESP